ncbi:MAG TPA: Cof-type HAD-IIB family hydrolase [Geminicoccaceae bacterium]|nr:Cof-type HAD-IIB family hydrolase [Geminicoccaceae bacterium]
MAERTMTAAAAPRRPTAPRPRPARIALLLSDVDGTLVTSDKTLTDGSKRAVGSLRAAGIRFAVTSSRPPAGLRTIVEALGIDTPVAAFNGGMIVAPVDGLPPLASRLLPPEVGIRAIDFLGARGVDVWVFTAARWLLRDRAGAYVAHEERTVQFGPTVVEGFGPFLDGVGKLVGVSDDFGLLERCEAEMRREFGVAASVARSQRYYLDVAHPLANKGTAVVELAERLGIPVGEIATIGDAPNDVAMFARSGFSIAMGNAAPAVREAADVAVAATNAEDGFAKAVERYVLGDGRP